MPEGVLVIVPPPTLEMPSVYEPVGVDVTRANVAVTFTAVLPATVQEAVPAHPPPVQPLKVDPEDGAAVRVTNVPKRNASKQSAPQLMPAGLLVTEPAPSPTLVAVTWRPPALAVPHATAE